MAKRDERIGKGLDWADEIMSKGEEVFKHGQENVPEELIDLAHAAQWSVTRGDMDILTALTTYIAVAYTAGMLAEASK
jgi:hypothetical protein